MTTSIPSVKRVKFKTTLPSNGATVWYHPFVAAQEKAMLIAQESKDIETILKTIEDVIHDSIVESDNPDKILSAIDMEWLLLHLRAKSVSNLASVKIEDPDTKEKVDLTIDVENDIKIIRTEGHTNKVKVGEDSVLILRFPTRLEWQLFLTSEGDKKKLLDVLFSCVVGLVQDDQEYDLSTLSFDELIAWCDQNLDESAVQQIAKFFDTMPHIRYEKKYTNKNGKEQTFVLEGLQSFFI